MNFLTSLFRSSKPQQQLQQPVEKPLSMLDPNFRQVRIKDIKTIISDPAKLDRIMKYQPQSSNDQFKVLYTLHMLLTSDQMVIIDKVVAYIEDGCMSISTQNTNNKDMSIVIRTNMNFNYTQQFISEPQNTVQGQNSMYLNVNDVRVQIIQQIQTYEQITKNETDLVTMYYNYVQRLANNIDIYRATKFSNFPDENQTRKSQFVWLFKLINLLTFKLSLLPLIKNSSKQNTQNSLIIRDISFLVYTDCLQEYQFLKIQISEMVEDYTQYQVKDCIQFYELYHYLKELTIKMRQFYDMRLSFTLSSTSHREIKWFCLDKKQELEIEHYVSKAKLINSTQFRKSLQVPNQRAIMDNLQKAMNNPSSAEKQPICTAKHSNSKKIQLYSPINKYRVEHEDF